jgi:hypothetical protein
MKYTPGYLTDNTWKCGCGSLNAAYRETCGKCDKPKPKKDE